MNTCPLCKGTKFNVCTPTLNWVFIECATKGCHFTRSLSKAKIIAAAFMPEPKPDIKPLTDAVAAMNAAGVPFIESADSEEPREMSDLDYHGQHETFRA